MAAVLTTDAAADPADSIPSSGVFVVDKPQGVTSHDVVAAARKLLHMKKVGHAGTLDPMATGALVIGFGKATRLLNVITGADKTYETVIRLGQSTATDDAEGSITREYDTSAVSDGQIYAAARSLTGTIRQVPSAFSAVKVNGRRAYDLAREGRPAELAARTVTISDFTVDSIVRRKIRQDGSSSPDGSRSPAEYAARAVIDIHAHITCSSGTYIRAVARDLGAILSNGAHLTMLRRIRVGKFMLDGAQAGQPVRPAAPAVAEKQAFTERDGGTAFRNRAAFPDNVQRGLQHYLYSPAEAAALAMPVLAISDADTEILRHGGMIPAHITSLTAAVNTDSHELIALVEPWKHRTAKPAAVFIA